jgi:hypothetical protein
MARMTIALEGWSEDLVCPLGDVMGLVQGLLTVLVTLSEQGCEDCCTDDDVFMVESQSGVLLAQFSWASDE